MFAHIGSLNDLWMYNLTSGLWTWLAGSNGTSQYATYGLPGVAAVGNVPGARYGFSMVIDSASRAIFVFGGVGNVASGVAGNI